MVKATTKKWLRLAAVLYIAILVMAAVASFAWFVFGNTASIETSNNLVITSGNNLEIALYDELTGDVIAVNGEAFGNEIHLNTHYGDNSDIETERMESYPDITGDGKVFYFPTVLDEHDQPMTSADTFRQIRTEAKVDGVKNADRDMYYITVCLQFRTTAAMDVYLAQGSYVLGASELTGVSPDNASVFGNFSRDAIAGAARVAFLEDVNGVPTLKNVWIPNDKYELSYDPVTAEDKAAAWYPDKIIETNAAHEEIIANFKVSGNREADIGYMQKKQDSSVMDMISYTVDDYLNRSVTLGSDMLASSGTSEHVPMINNAPKLLSFTAEEIQANGGSMTKKMIVRIWIEGTDRESDKATVGGELKYKLNFVGINKSVEVTKPNVTLNGNVLEGIPEGMTVQYSYNGIDWSSYEGNQLSDTAGHSVIYVRYAETAGTQAGSEYQMLHISGAS